MNKEDLFKEYEIKYQEYLYGDCSYDDTSNVVEKIHSLVHEEIKDSDEIRSIIKANNQRIEEIEKEVDSQYERDIIEPLTEELLEFLQFEGLVKSVQYKKRAEELKEKLQKYDGVFKIRQRALRKFFCTKIGSRYNSDERSKIELILKLGALDTKNL